MVVDDTWVFGETFKERSWNWLTRLLWVEGPEGLKWEGPDDGFKDEAEGETRVEGEDDVVEEVEGVTDCDPDLSLSRDWLNFLTGFVNHFLKAPFLFVDAVVDDEDWPVPPEAEMQAVVEEEEAVELDATALLAIIDDWSE